MEWRPQIDDRGCTLSERCYSWYDQELSGFITGTTIGWINELLHAGVALKRPFLVLIQHKNKKLQHTSFVCQSHNNLHCGSTLCNRSCVGVQRSLCFFSGGHPSMSAVITSWKILISWDDWTNVLASPTWQMSRMVSVNSYQRLIKNVMTAWIFTKFNYCSPLLFSPAPCALFLSGGQTLFRVLDGRLLPPWWILQKSERREALMKIHLNQQEYRWRTLIFAEVLIGGSKIQQAA